MNDFDPHDAKPESGHAPSAPRSLTGPATGLAARSGPKPLSPWVKPLVWLHRLVSRDTTQHREWRARVEAIEHAQAIESEPSPEGKALLADRATWRRIRATSLAGSSGLMGLGAVWMASLIPMYALGHGFGWLAASAYLLPVPLAWRVGRRMWDRAALDGMKELGSRPTVPDQLRALSTGMVRGMGVGAAMGFTLVFSQALISWFMTPAPTLGLELVWDLFHGSVGASVGAVAGAVLGPLASRPAPSATLPAPHDRMASLPEP